MSGLLKPTDAHRKYYVRRPPFLDSREYTITTSLNPAPSKLI